MIFNHGFFKSMSTLLPFSPLSSGIPMTCMLDLPQQFPQVPEDLFLFSACFLSVQICWFFPLISPFTNFLKISVIVLFSSKILTWSFFLCLFLVGWLKHFFCNSYLRIFVTSFQDLGFYVVASVVISSHDDGHSPVSWYLMRGLTVSWRVWVLCCKILNHA